jgi:hypothetical protein
MSTMSGFGIQAATPSDPGMKELTKVEVGELDGNRNLEIQFGSSSTTFMHLIIPGETAASIIQILHERHGNIKYRQAVETIIYDLASRCHTQEDGIRSIDLKDSQWEEFEYHWRKQIFRNLLDKFKLKDQLSLEDAIQVVQEHIIIAPVMES